MLDPEHEAELATTLRRSLMQLAENSPDPLTYLSKVENEFVTLLASGLGSPIGKLSEPQLAVEIQRIVRILLPELKAYFQQLRHCRN